MIDRSTVRIALRTLGRQRGFAAVAILSIALAIALNTTMYSVLDALLAPHIGARNPENLYFIQYSGDFRRVLGPDVLERALEAGVGHYEGATGSRYSSPPFARFGAFSRRVESALASVRTNYFDVLGAEALQGRTFAAADEREGWAPVVISDRLAESLFLDESPINRTLVLDGNGFTVIGVVQRSTLFRPLRSDVYVLRQPATPPIPIDMLRLREHLEPRQVRELLQVVAARLAVAAGESSSQTAFTVYDFKTRQFQVNDFQIGLVAAVLAVLLVACANLSSLQLARGLARSRELAVRAAVGATHRQLVMQLLLETAILAAAGFALGVLLTLWGIHIVKASIPPIVSAYIIEPQTSWRVFAFAAAASLVCLTLVGLVPALRVARVDPNTLLKAGSGTGATREHRKRYGVMIVAQIGLSLPVLLGAVALAKSVMPLHDQHYLRRRFGYDVTPLLYGSVPVWQQIGSSMRAVDAAAELTSRAMSVPGVVEAAASIPGRPLNNRLTIDNTDGGFREEGVRGWGYTIATPSYFRAHGRRIIGGRDFEDGDMSGLSVILDDRSAKLLWGTQNPIGRSIKFGDVKSNLPWHRVVGVMDGPTLEEIRVFDFATSGSLGSIVRVMSLNDSLVMPPPSLGSERSRRAPRVSIVARTSGEPRSMAVRLERVMQGGVRDGAGVATVLPLVDAASIVHAGMRIPVSMARQRQGFIATLFATFALFGLGLVALGVHGIVAHSVAERRREIAVRISLGATARNVLHAVLREGNVAVLGGIAIGLLAARQAIWWLEPFINFLEDPYDAPLFAGAAAALFLVAILSAAAPALRATRTNPVEALRHE